MENCFICLNMCKDRVCPTCNCYAHFKCWVKYTRSTSTEDKSFSKCPICKIQIEYHKSVTRKDTKKERIGNEIETIKNLLLKCNTCNNLEERMEIVLTIFNYYDHNRIALNHSKALSDIVSKKLHEFYITHNWRSANFYHLRLFGTHISR